MVDQTGTKINKCKDVMQRSVARHFLSECLSVREA